MSRLYIGCSGFSYPHWRGCFYPGRLPQKQWFGYYCSRFATVELNVTFYRLPKPESFIHWRQESPDGFTFSVKGSRFITHVKRLIDPERPLVRFFDGALLLGDKLRVVLWQFPPGFACNIRRLERFLSLLASYPARSAMEFRHHSWCCDEVFSLCRAYGVALCMADWPVFIADLPRTADFTYFRRHGHDGSYGGCYSRDELLADAAVIGKHLTEGRDVYFYFNNDAEGYATRNARELLQILGSKRLGGDPDETHL